MESSEGQPVLGNDVRKKQQLAAEKERIKKEWEGKKTKMTFLETDPFAEPSPKRGPNVVKQSKSMTGISPRKTLRRVKSEADVLQKAKQLQKPQANLGDWHEPPNTSNGSEKASPQHLSPSQQIARRVVSFGGKDQASSSNTPLSHPSSQPTVRKQLSLNIPAGKSSVTQAKLSTSASMKFKEMMQGSKPIPPLGTIKNPATEFKGGPAWIYLDPDQDELCLDLLWPIVMGDDQYYYKMNVEELKPLCAFRNLRYLKITGMLVSYQKYIWQCAWLNYGLETLILEMASVPRVFAHLKKDWPWIKDNWAPRENGRGIWDNYIGNGDGALHENAGEGAYLDNRAIEKAKLRAGMAAIPLYQLSIAEMTLRGFVVDACPFEPWFDPERLRRLTLIDCVDAGFRLPETMAGTVTIAIPDTIPKSLGQPLISAFVNVKKHLKIIKLKGGSKIAERFYHGKGKKWEKPKKDTEGGKGEDDATGNKKQKGWSRFTGFFGKK